MVICSSSDYLCCCTAAAVCRQEVRGDQGPGGRGVRRHPLELPHVHDHPQGLARHRRRLPGAPPVSEPPMAQPAKGSL